MGEAFIVGDAVVQHGEAGECDAEVVVGFGPFVGAAVGPPEDESLSGSDDFGVGLGECERGDGGGLGVVHEFSLVRAGGGVSVRASMS